MRPQDLLEGMDPLFPADFFKFNIEIKQTLTLLPDFSDLLGEDSLSSLSLSWSDSGLSGVFSIKNPLEASFFPDFIKGDAIELFLDTRDNKKSGFATKFCHHFVFLGKEVNGVRVQEITKFRLEDAHTLCDPAEILFKVIEKKGGYEATFTLPKEVLHGYDPLQFSKLGLAYRIHRYKGKPMHFPFSGKYFEPLQHPSLWASLLLV
ncbi:MAG: hypothetical protein JSS09_03715 [Verrucomicrobia bacterium]|nr:hypothetical protein [Verrucomicrobiota bacterium]